MVYIPKPSAPMVVNTKNPIQDKIAFILHMNLGTPRAEEDGMAFDSRVTWKENASSLGRGVAQRPLI
jgi:hypothetical protein